MDDVTVYIFLIVSVFFNIFLFFCVRASAKELDKFEDRKNFYQTEQKKFEENEKILKEHQKAIEDLMSSLEDDIHKLIQTPQEQFPKIATAIGDLARVKYERVIEYQKKDSYRFSHDCRDFIHENSISIWDLSKKTKEILTQKKELEYKFLYEGDQIDIKRQEIKKDLEKIQHLKAEIDTLIQDPEKKFSQIATAMGDLVKMHYEEAATYLRTKQRPALIESERISDLASKTQKIVAEKKLLEYKYYYEKEDAKKEIQRLRYDFLQDQKKANENLERERKKLEQERQKIQEKKDLWYNIIFDTENRINKLIEQPSIQHHELALAFADLATIQYEEAAQQLMIKKRPAMAEALRIKDLRKETQQILAEKKELEYKYSYIIELYPDIIDVFDKEDDKGIQVIIPDEEIKDAVSFFVSQDEYTNLSPTQRNQLALDRYVERRKSKWQVGRDYEMYIGYEYEKRGFKVSYTGIIKKLEDMGRDLIAKNDKQVFIIQCKNWSKEKTIHEKHIFQLYGTVVLYNIENPKSPAIGIFVTTTSLSEKAKEVAEFLNIKVIENKELGDFPRIKCNVNPNTGEKIYHLPFDQQYDKTIIEESKGESFAYTVEEAEAKGFRRAFRYYGND